MCVYVQEGRVCRCIDIEIEFIASSKESRVEL